MRKLKVASSLFFLFILAIQFHYFFIKDEASSEPKTNICKIDDLYTKSFDYFLPKDLLRSYYLGMSYDKEHPYTPEEISRIEQDINTIYSNILRRQPMKEKVVFITAGAPGAGKTTIMRHHLIEEKQQGRSYAYIDPDDVCLKGMSLTWAKAFEPSSSTTFEERCKAYNKWRPASNAATHFTLGRLIKEGIAIHYGTTSTSPHSHRYFEFFKDQGYKVNLIHVTASDDVRKRSVSERDKTFVQTTQKDLVEKGQLLPQRISDTYIAYADHIDFYYRNKFDKDAILVASWYRVDHPNKSGELEIKDSTYYRAMVATHNEKCRDLNLDDELLWENAVEKVSVIKA